jgi:hypothetical protein
MDEPRDHTFREQWWKQILGDPEVGEGLLAAALAISTEVRWDGTRALMSRQRLAENLVVSPATATRRTQELVDLGYLEIVERGGRRGVIVKANVYDLCLPHRRIQVSPWEAGNFPANDVPSAQNDVPSAQNDVPSAHPGDTPHFTSLINSPKVKRPPANAAGGRPRYKNDWRAKDLELFRAVIAQENDELIFIAPRIYEAIAATGKDWPGKYIDGIAERGGSGVSEYLASLGFDQWAGDDVNQDQKQEHLQEEPRCQVADCRQPETNHHLWMAMLDPDRRHPFVKASS